MSRSRLFMAALVGGLALMVNVPRIEADPLEREIDIRPVINLNPRSGNAHGVAYDRDAQVIYLSHGSDLWEYRPYLYTLDMNGAVLATVDWWAFYGPSSYPASLSYDETARRLYVQVERLEPNQTFTSRVVEIDPSGPAILREFPLSSTDHALLWRDDGFWQALDGGDVLRHYGHGGGFLEDLPLGGFGPGVSGPSDVASSFADGGFFLSDHHGRRIVEVDRQGNLIRVGSTEFLEVGGCLAFDSDVVARRIFVQAGNMVIYVLNEEVMEMPTVLEQVTWGSVKARYR
jgi:hypothetical protein